MKRSTWIVMICAAVYVGALAQYLVYRYGMDKQLNGMREKLMATASYAARGIDADLIFRVPLRMEGDKSAEYKMIFGKLSDVKDTDSNIKYVYIMTATDEPGILQYVVDADPLPEIVTAKSPRSFPGDKYDARNIPQALDAFKGKSTADRGLVEDEWGATISGYAPIRDAGGRTVAILGVDMDAGPLYPSLKRSHLLLRVFLISGALLLIAVMFSFVEFFRKVSRPAKT